MGDHGAVHKDTFGRWKDITKDIDIDWMWMAQSVLRYNVVLSGSSSIREVGYRRHGERTTRKRLLMKLKASTKNLDNR